MIRLFRIGLIGLCFGGCAVQSEEQFAPLFYGHYDLLSRADRDAILEVARKRAEILMAGSHIENVKVFSATEVDASFDRDAAGSEGSLYLEKRAGKWEITSENKLFAPPEGIRMTEAK